MYRQFSGFQRPQFTFHASFWAHLSYTCTEIQVIWSHNDIEIMCLKELHVTLDIVRTHRVQDIVSIWYMTSQKLGFVVHSPVKNCSSTLSSKHCHLTFFFISPTRFWYHFYNICKVLVYFDVVIQQQHFNLQVRDKFPSSLKNMAYHSLFCLRNFIAVENFFMYFLYQILILSFSFRLKEEHQQFIACNKLTAPLSLVDFLINFEKCHFWGCSIFYSYVGICNINDNGLIKVKLHVKFEQAWHWKETTSRSRSQLKVVKDRINSYWCWLWFNVTFSDISAI